MGTSMAAHLSQFSTCHPEPSLPNMHWGTRHSFMPCSPAPVRAIQHIYPSTGLAPSDPLLKVRSHVRHSDRALASEISQLRHEKERGSTADHNNPYHETSLMTNARYQAKAPQLPYALRTPSCWWPQIHRPHLFNIAILTAMVVIPMVWCGKHSTVHAKLLSHGTGPIRVELP